jgi:hypothetical protein
MKKILFILLLLPAFISAQNLRRWGSTGAISTLYGDWFYNAHPSYSLADSLKLVDFRLLKDTAAALRAAMGGGSGMAIGGTVTSGTTGSVLFVGGSSALAQDNSNFFWDNTNKRFGIGLNTPAYILDVLRAVTGQATDSRTVNVTTAGSTFNTTAATRTNYAGYYVADATVSAGGFALTNIAVEGMATGGDNNWGIVTSNSAFTGKGKFYQSANNTTKLEGGPGTDNIQFGSDNRIRLNTPSVIVPSGSLSVGANSDDGIGAIQAYGKITVTTVDSSGSPANVVWHDPNTKELKKAPYLPFLKGSTTWQPGTVAAGSSTTTTVSVTGAVTTDVVHVNKVTGGLSNGEIYDAYVSSANTVTIRVHNVSTGSANYNTTETYNVIVLKY